MILCCGLFLLCVSLPVVAGGHREDAQPVDGEHAAETQARPVAGTPVIGRPADAEAEAAAGRVDDTTRFTVEEAVHAAVSNSVELEIERLNLKKSAAAVREAEAAAGPQITLQTSGSALSNPPEGYRIEKGAFAYLPTAQSPTPVAFPDRDYVLVEDAEHSFFRISATLSRPLFTWGKLEGAVTLADIESNIAGEKYVTRERNLERSVRLAYFGTIFADNAARVLGNAERIAGQILGDKNEAFEGGIITRQDVLDAAAKKAALSAQLARTIEAGSSARLTLSRLTGIETDAKTLASGYRREPLSTDEGEFLSAALQSSGMRAELRYRIRQAETLLKIEEGSKAFLPDLSLNLSVDVSGQKVPVVGANWIDSWDTNLTVTLGTHTTLFDAGASGSKIEQAELSLESAKLALNGYDLNLELQVRNLVEAAKTAWAQVSRADAELELAQEVERNASVSFDNELITRAELRSAKLARLAAELAHEEALFSYESALIELETKTGVNRNRVP